MRAGIHLVCDALEMTITEIEGAMVRAKNAGDRMAERNLGFRKEQLRVAFRGMMEHAEYITQPRFEEYFNKE